MTRRSVSQLPDLALAVDEACTDLLLLEEFYASDGFCDWFLSRTAGPEWEGARVRHVGRSVVRYGRESDLEVTVERADGCTLRLLIENKIAAAFQKKQVEAYADRARRYVEAGECTTARTVLVAPRAYGAAARFDHAVEYEAIRDWYLIRKNARDRYRARVFQSGIDKAEGRTYSEPDAKVTEFWQRYFQLASTEAPALCMADPGPRAASSLFCYFNEVGFPPKVVLVHKMDRGHVDLQFYGLGKRVDELRDWLSAHLLPGARIERAHGSAVVRIDAPPLSVWDPFDHQIDAVRTCLHTAVQALEWTKGIPDFADRLGALRSSAVADAEPAPVGV